jgi:hypothetical protein
MPDLQLFAQRRPLQLQRFSPTFHGRKAAARDFVDLWILPICSLGIGGESSLLYPRNELSPMLFSQFRASIGGPLHQ